MGRYEVHRTDGNADELYRAARKLGFSVEMVGTPVDAIWGIYDQTVAVEVKTATGKLRPRQKWFFRRFKGYKARVRTVGDVLALYQELRRRHDLIFGVRGCRSRPTRGSEVLA